MASKILLIVFLTMSLGVADARADYWRSPNPERILIVGESKNIDIRLWRLLQTANHSLDLQRDGISLPAASQYPIVLADTTFFSRAASYLEDPDSTVIRIEGASERILAEVEARLARRAGNWELVKERLAALHADNIRISPDIYFGGTNRGRRVIGTPDGQPHLLVVGDFDPMETLLRLARFHRLERVPSVAVKPTGSFGLVVADASNFNAAVVEYGGFVPVIQVNPGDPELQTIYEVEIALASSVGDLALATELRKRQDGFDYSKLDSYPRITAADIGLSPMPLPVTSRAKGKPSNLSLWGASAILTLCVWFATFLILRRAVIPPRLARALDAWSLPQIASLAAMVAAVLVTPLAGAVSGVSFAVAQALRNNHKTY